LGNQNHYSPSGQMSPDLDRHADVERKYEKAQRRWETVLSHKHQNTEVKYKHMKDMLAKKFKRESEMAVNMKAN